jgi:hypothetical protein
MFIPKPHFHGGWARDSLEPRLREALQGALRHYEAIWSNGAVVPSSREPSALRPAECGKGQTVELCECTIQTKTKNMWGLRVRSRLCQSQLCSLFTCTSSWSAGVVEFGVGHRTNRQKAIDKSMGKVRRRQSAIAGLIVDFR